MGFITDIITSKHPDGHEIQAATVELVPRFLTNEKKKLQEILTDEINYCESLDAEKYDVVRTWRNCLKILGDTVDTNLPQMLLLLHQHISEMYAQNEICIQMVHLWQVQQLLASITKVVQSSDKEWVKLWAPVLEYKASVDEIKKQIEDNLLNESLYGDEDWKQVMSSGKDDKESEGVSKLTKYRDSFVPKSDAKLQPSMMLYMHSFITDPKKHIITVVTAIKKAQHTITKSKEFWDFNVYPLLDQQLSENTTKQSGGSKSSENKLFKDDGFKLIDCNEDQIDCTNNTNTQIKGQDPSVSPSKSALAATLFDEFKQKGVKFVTIVNEVEVPADIVEKPYFYKDEVTATTKPNDISKDAKQNAQTKSQKNVKIQPTKTNSKYVKSNTNTKLDEIDKLRKEIDELKELVSVVSVSHSKLPTNNIHSKDEVASDDDQDTDDEEDKGKPQSKIKKSSRFTNDFKKHVLTKACLEIEAMIKRLDGIVERRIKPSIEALNKELAEEGKVLSIKVNSENGGGDEIKRCRSLMNLYRKTLAFYKRTVNEIYQLNFDFMVKELRGKAVYLNRWKAAPEFDTINKSLYADKDSDMAAIHEAKLAEIKKNKELEAAASPDTIVARELSGGGTSTSIVLTKTFDDYDELLFKLKGKANAIMDKNISDMQVSLGMLPIHTLTFEEDKEVLEEDRDKTQKYLVRAQNKMLALYNNSYTYMDIILDNEFIAQYILKLINYGFLVAALILADKLFSEMYMQSVYAKGGDAPNILIFVGLFIGISVAFTLFLLTIMVLLSFMFKHPSNSFIISTHLIKHYLIDYIITVVVVGLFSIIIGSIIQQKRYFRYRTEGLRGVRALREIVMSISAIIILVPFFVLF